MIRDDYERRRLRALYERNKRRVTALADARDQRRGEENEMSAPRRFLVSARRLREAGFGRGQVQIRRIYRRREGYYGSRRYGDSDIYRRFNRDRFMRVSDYDRDARRYRYRGNGAEAERRLALTGARRFGGFRRSRFALRSRYQRAGDYRDLENRGNNERRGVPNRRVTSSRPYYPRQSNIRSYDNRRGDENRYRAGNERNSRDSPNFRNSERDDRSYRRGENRSNGGSFNNNNRRGSSRITQDQLDAQLDAYRNNESVRIENNA